MRIPDIEWLTIVVIMISVSVTLGVIFTFSQYRNPLSFSYLSFTINELRELCGGGYYSIDNSSSIEST